MKMFVDIRYGDTTTVWWETQLDVVAMKKRRSGE
jgi:hypothetical protein